MAKGNGTANGDTVTLGHIVMRAVVLGLVLVASLAAADPRTPTLRLTSADYSLAVRKANASQPCRWRRNGTLANQLQRAALAEGLTYVALPKLIPFARIVCPSVLSAVFSSSGLSGITSKLDPIYEAASMRQGDWHEIDQCRDYTIPWNLEEKIAACVTASSTAVRCAQVITPEQQDFLDLSIVNGRCVRGGRVAIVAPWEPYDSYRANKVGLLVTDTPIAKPDAAEVAALRAGLAAHATSSGVDAAQRRIEDLADDEREHRFFRLGDFLGSCDFGWTTTECAAWDRRTHAAYTRWEQSVEAGDPFAAEQDKIDHNLAHLCKNVGADDRLLVRFSCPAGRGFAGNMDRCVATTCREALAA
jgi:hypothetical protein